MSSDTEAEHPDLKHAADGYFDRPKDGGLTVLEGSHHLHEQYFAENGGVDEGRRDGRPHG